ncbi:MAG: exodeoxyribonuclease VII small subunit [Sulfuriferula sp.]
MTNPASPPASFETAMTELERLVTEMESGQLTLEQSLAAYQRGTELLQFCHSTLTAAQQQVQILENGTLQAFNNLSTTHDN